MAQLEGQGRVPNTSHCGVKLQHLEVQQDREREDWRERKKCLERQLAWEREKCLTLRKEAWAHRSSGGREALENQAADISNITRVTAAPRLYRVSAT